MKISLVHIHVKEEHLEAFIDATKENASNSIKEPGVARFDFIQQREDPTRFTLIEAYYDEEAPAKHKETTHYNKWRETVADMMVEPRQGVHYDNILPDESGWASK